MMENKVNGHPDPRDHKITRDDMTPLTRIEGRRRRKILDGHDREAVDQLIEYEWPGSNNG